MVRSDRALALMDQKGWSDICVKLAYLNHISLTDNDGLAGIGFISGTEKCIVPMNQDIDVEAQLEEKTKELEYQKGFLKSVDAKLNNERFVSGAPAAVVDKERAKKADAEERIRILEDEIARLGK
jgi:valyl-tRNA synthetase